MRWSTVSILLLAFAMGLRALGQPVPKSAPPEFVVVSSVDKDKNTIKILTVRGVLVPEFVERVVECGGKKTTKRELMHRSRLESSESQLSLNSFQVHDIAGKEIRGDELWKSLVPGKMVLRQVDAQPLDPAYYKVFARDTLILVP